MSDVPIPHSPADPQPSVAAVAAGAAEGTDSTSNGVGATGQPYLQFTFTGRAGAYFRIWIVNLFLSLVSVGLWSPWAKVRKRRYFYGNTWLAGANFEYHGNPVAILRGRLLAAAAVGIYWIVENLVPDAGPWLLAALLCGTPWIIARSLKFSAANSSYRGIRFAFSGTQRDVALAVWPAAATIVAYVAVGQSDTLDVLEHPGRYFARLAGLTALFVVSYPYAVARVRQLTVGKSAWGDRAFSTTMRVRNVYSIYAIGLLVCCIPVVILFILGSLTIMVTMSLATGNRYLAGIFSGLLAALGWVSVIVTWLAYSRSRMTNLVLNTTTLSNLARLQAAIAARALAKLYIVNLLAIVGSCGLLIPWAVMRLTRYRLQQMSVQIESSLTAVAATVVQNPQATGEELGEMFGFDLAL